MTEQTAALWEKGPLGLQQCFSIHPQRMKNYSKSNQIFLHLIKLLELRFLILKEPFITRRIKSNQALFIQHLFILKILRKVLYILQQIEANVSMPPPPQTHTHTHLKTVKIKTRLENEKRKPGLTHITHLLHDGLLLLAQIVLVVFWKLLVQVLMNFQHLRADRFVSTCI